METAQSKHRLLLVDGDPKSLRVLDVSLKKAGFDVSTATSGHEALALLESAAPDLIISDTDLAEMDGFELCSQIKAKQDWAKIPFLFVSGRKSIEDKIRGLELGVDDYLTKPIYIKEIGIRVRTALQRAERERMESRRDGRTRFAGDLSDVGVVDLVQTIELNRKSGIIHIVNADGRRGSIFFRDGKVIDAEVGRLSGAHALYRLFSWSDGQFAVEFKQIRRHEVIETPMAPLLMEGMRRLDESVRLLESLPATSSVLEVDCRVLAEELAELPDEMNSVLRLCDGARSLQEVVEDSDHPDLEALSIISELYDAQIIFARDAPERAGEAHPGERLARWLSEGGAEDGEAAEDSSASAEFAAPDDLVPDRDVVPSETPHPRPLPEPGSASQVDAAPLAPVTDVSDSSRPVAEDANPVARATGSDADMADSAPAVLAPASMLSPEESLGAILPSRDEAVREESNEFARPPNTLKGVPVDELFPTQASGTDEGAAEPSDQTAVVTAPTEQRSTKPLGLAERLLSEDSALRASAMHEAIAEQDARVENPASTERNTREYGDNTAQAAAAIVQEVVSAAHEAKAEGAAPAPPARPSKEVDWGAWTASSGPGSEPEASPSGPESSAAPAVGRAVEVAASVDHAAPPLPAGPAPGDSAMAEPGTAAPAPPRDPVSSKDDEPTATASTPNETTEAHPAATESEGQPAEAEPAPATATPSPGPTELPKQAETTPAKQERPASSKPSANTVRVRNARKPSGARRMWLMFAGAFALGMLGYLALSQQEEVATTPSLPTPTTSATATATPTIVPAPLAGTAPAIATATSKASTRPAKAAGLAKTESATAPAKPAGKPSSLGSSSASSIARETSTGTASADPQRAAALARKCIDTDDGGKGKTRAVAGVCRTALEADPNNAGVMLILARAEIDRGRLVEAKTLAKKALTTAPDRLDAYVLLGTAEQEAGHLDEAESAYRKYLELAPDGPYAKELRAILDNL